MSTNDYQAFGTGAGANVLTQSQYLALAARTAGFSAGLAKSAEVNKVLRQASMIAAALAQLVVNRLAVDVLDDGDLSGLITKLGSALAGGNGSITNAMLANMANGTVKANLSGSLGAPSDVTLATLMAAFALATTTAAGPVKLSTNALAQAGTDATTALTPAALFSTFTSSLGASGYYKNSSGLIFQWGTSTATLTNDGALPSVTFPTTFPTACQGVWTTGNNAGSSVDSDSQVKIISKSTTGFSPYSNAAASTSHTDGYQWFAIGN